MRFTRLRISGFKSFVDAVEFPIGEGLTGIVGPNGCGKSNLLEALRWVMGENRARNMRGGEMDDVIFAGTGRRPQRNLADVTLVIDNSGRTAPSAFNDSDTIEVTRRIERDAGSVYRINGRDVRLKDVQLLFADAATGAHSPALVSQGRIGALVNARSQDRRAILEEAAGVAGLYSRRKEAEQRLKAAETNLLRVEDVIGQLDAQAANLRRQARQAEKYRELSDEIRKAEGLLIHSRWRAAAETQIRLDRDLHEASASVAALTAAAAALMTERTELAASLPELRGAEAEAAAALQRLKLAAESLDREERRLEDARAAVAARIAQTSADLAREEREAEDARAHLARFEAEKAELTAAAGEEAAQEQAAGIRLSEASQAASAAEAGLDRLNREAAAVTARREALQEAARAAARRSEKLEAECKRVAAEIAGAESRNDANAALREAEDRITEAGTALKTAEIGLKTAEETRIAAEERRSAVIAALAERQGEVKALEAETLALQRLLKDGAAKGDKPPVSESLSVAPGYELALGAALGEDLDAPESAEADRGWQNLGEMEDAFPLPAGTRPLSDFVTGPPALSRRLQQVAVASDGSLAVALRQGQRLVTKDGALWRWDGFRLSPGAPSPAAIRIRNRNRLDELTLALEAGRAALSEASSAASAANEALTDAREKETAARHERSASEARLAAARNKFSALEHEAQAARSRIEGLKAAAQRLEKDREEAAREAEEAEKMALSAPDAASLDAPLVAMRAHVAEARASLAETRALFDGLRRECEIRRARLQQIGAGIEAWSLRLASAEKQIGILSSRLSESNAEEAELAAAPGDFRDRRAAVLQEIERNEAIRKARSDALAAREAALAEKDRSWHAGEARLRTAREERVRIEAGRAAAEETRKALASEIGDLFGCPPSHLLEQLGFPESEAAPPLDETERNLYRLKIERERIGPVNLRADEELQALLEQSGHLSKEKADLETAIHRLRGAIGSLNREGRERLLKAFDEVNGHFKDLFTKLFGGGEARLELTESDDPLEAGLEILASPPGKKLQNLGLLSGGEQALTALSLIFAVFMTNPAPVCVLDEVDAPLDDANVERFCDLLDEMRQRTRTRFLIVTHNAISMARLDRLFGVTMAERGVSTLVSVDLSAAGKLLAAE